MYISLNMYNLTPEGRMAYAAQTKITLIHNSYLIFLLNYSM